MTKAERIIAMFPVRGLLSPCVEKMFKDRLQDIIDEPVFPDRDTDITPADGCDCPMCEDDIPRFNRDHWFGKINRRLDALEKLNDDSLNFPATILDEMVRRYDTNMKLQAEKNSPIPPGTVVECWDDDTHHFLGWYKKQLTSAQNHRHLVSDASYNESSKPFLGTWEHVKVVKQC